MVLLILIIFFWVIVVMIEMNVGVNFFVELE